MITTGSYRKRENKNGKHSWQIVVELPKDPMTGKRVRRYRTLEGGSKKDAERAMHEFIRELEKGYYVTNNKITKKIARLLVALAIILIIIFLVILAT